MITTVTEALLAIEKIDAKPTLRPRDVVERGRIYAALEQVRQYTSWTALIRHYDSHGNVTMRGQESRSLAEWIDTRMSPLAKRLAGLA